MHWFYDPEITESSTAIFERELTHFKALRIRNDDQIVITNGLGVSHKAVVVDVSSGQIRLLAKSIANEQSVTIHLVQALAKGGRDESAVQTACELGVASVTPFQAKRSIVEWGSKTARNQERWQPCSGRKRPAEQTCPISRLCEDGVSHEVQRDQN